MKFDDEIDELKKLQAARRISGDEIVRATKELEKALAKNLDSRRLKFTYDEDDETGPRIGIFYADAPFHIGTVWIQPDGSVAFGSESEYFPPLAAFDDQAEFLKEARDFLKEGLAHFELDEEDEELEV